MISDDRIAGKLIRHFRILGVCWVVYGILCLVTAVWLISFTNTATLMFGALLNRVPDPFSMMNIFHFIYILQIAWKGATGILGIVAGLGLIAGSRSAKTIAIVAAFLSLSSIPLGTTLGIYSLIVLLMWSPQRIADTVPGESVSSMRQEQMTTLRHES